MIHNATEILKKNNFEISAVGTTLSWKEGMTLTPAEPNVAVCIPLAGGTVGQKYDLRLCVRIEGERDTYSACGFVTDDGKLVDDGLERGAPAVLHVPATAVERDGAICACCYLMAAEGESLTLLSVTADDFCEEPTWLGGAELLQLKPRRNLGMGYLLKTPDGRLLIFDGGRGPDTDDLGQIILDMGGHVDGWFITHFHCDHIDAVIGVLEKYDVTVDNFYYDFRGADNPNFIGDGDNPCIQHLEDVLAACRGNKIANVVTTRRGDVYGFGAITVKVLNDAIFYEDEDNPGNDSGIMFKIETPGESILMTGDMGWTRGDLCLEDAWCLGEMRTCRVVQMAHHGQRGVTEKFYSAIDDIRVCLIPAQLWLFHNDRYGEGFNSCKWESTFVRNWMRRREVGYHYPAVDDDVVIR